MMKNLKRFALVLCLVALCVSMMGVAAFAVSYDPVTATIPVEITLSGHLPEVPDTFQVELTADDPAFPMPEGSQDGVYIMELTDDPADEFGPTFGNTFDITYDKHGIYTYTVKQLELGNEDCYQDAHTYKVIAQVINNEDYTAFDLIVVVYRDDQTEKRDDIIFENRYAMPTEVQLSATKTMDGKTPKEGAFEFELLDAQGNVLETVSNNETGDVIFLPISYYKADTYTYIIREVKGNNDKIIYDQSQYTAVVNVEKDDNGDYTATLAYVKDDKPVDGAAFANKTKPVTPQTGDTANPLLWGGIMAAALIAIVVLLLAMKKKTKKA